MWTSKDRTLLDAVLDQMIPASADGRVPAAGRLGTGEFILRIAASEPTTSVLIRQGLDHLAKLTEASGLDFTVLDAASRRDLLLKLEVEKAEAFQAILRHAYMGYYSRPDIRLLFGLSAQPTQPFGYEVPLESPELLAGLTADVVARGQCYRKC